MSVRVVMVMVTVAMIMVVVVLATQMVVSVSGVEDFHLDEVKDEAHHGDDEHDVALHLGRLEEALGGLDQKPAGHDPDGGDRDEGADDLGSVPTVGQAATRSFLSKVQR